MLILPSTALWGAVPKGCPQWLEDDSVPLCPAKGNVLPESFPALAHVVSDAPYHPQSETGKQFPVAFVEETLKGAGDHVPLFFLPVTEDTFHQIRKRVEELTADDPEKRKSWLASLIRVPNGARFTWQQDYFQTFVRPSGGLEMRYMRTFDGDESFTPNKYQVSRLTRKMNEVCSLIHLGPTIPPESVEGDPVYANAHQGGNVEGLPDGSCLTSTQADGKTFLEHFCPDTDNVVKLDISWLLVGHVDEVVATLQAPKKKAPCNYVLAIPSPKTALDLLKQHPKEKFFDFYSPNVPRETLNETRFLAEHNRTLCNAVIRNYLRENPPGNPEKKDDTHGWNFIPQAYAGDDDATQYRKFCALVTNEMVAKAIEGDPDLGAINTLVQSKVNSFREVLRKKLTDCKVEFLEMPVLYGGGKPVEVQGASPKDPIEKRLKLPDGMIRSLTPNTVNSTQSESSVIMSHPQNSAFKRHVEQSLEKLGMQARFIDAQDYATAGLGEVHCASQSLRYCRKEKK